MYDAQGHHVGAVSPYHWHSGALLVRFGRLFPTDISIPLAAVAGVDARGIHLSISRMDIMHQAWTGAGTEPAIIADAGESNDPSASA